MKCLDRSFCPPLSFCVTSKREVNGMLNTFEETVF